MTSTALHEIPFVIMNGTDQSIYIMLTTIHIYDIEIQVEMANIHSLSTCMGHPRHVQSFQFSFIYPDHAKIIDSYFSHLQYPNEKWLVSMIRKYHKHKPQTTPWHRKEEPLNHHETPVRQIKQSNHLSLPH